MANNYVCQQCGLTTSKWSGQCGNCKSWNSIVEELDIAAGQFTKKSTNAAKKIAKINLEKLDSNTRDYPRIKTDIGEFDRVLGGGLVEGSAILIGGDPGIGKSTLLIQALCSLANKNVKTLYISAEESVNQIKIRAQRLGLKSNSLQLACSTSLWSIIECIKSQKPDVIVIDSIQTLHLPELSSAPGTVSQVRACACELVNLAKKSNMTMLVVSHVTKEGQIAGPKVLEHMVDAVIYFEGEKDGQFRIVRSIKNRYGAANEVGVFEMEETGLKEVTNPSELFLSSKRQGISGSSVFVSMEGSRPILVEVQALIAPSFMPSPRRAVVGWEINRLAMILAVINARFGINLSNKEVYLNMVGGLKITEPAADLATVAALISANRDIALPEDIVFIGEVGLSGEIRNVSRLESRLKEAKKLGFSRAVIPLNNNKNIATIKNMEIAKLTHIRDLTKIISKI